jgi:beta-glucanase (GH16 family)
MKKWLTGAVLCLGLTMLALGNGVKAQQPWQLVWSDEFHSSRVAPVDSRYWNHDKGGYGWGNSELQYYSNSLKNVYQDGTGNLVIKAIRENNNFPCWYGKCQYTSGRITTKAKFEQKYGRFEARIRVPYGQGIWSAFWMLGAKFGSVNWPYCGEIDILENIGREPTTVHGTMHGPGYSGGEGISTAFRQNKPFADGFHVYAVEWEENEIRWYVDNILYQTRTPKDLPEGTSWVYNQAFFMILNVAVGGGWPGRPDSSSTFPQSMKIDYVRVYTR